MNNEINRRPTRGQRCKSCVEVCWISYIAIDQEIAAHLFRQGAHALFQRLTLIGKGQFRAFFAQLLCNPPSEAPVIGKPHDQPALARHISSHQPFPSSYNAFNCGSLIAGLAKAAFRCAPITRPNPTIQKNNNATITPAKLP